MTMTNLATRRDAPVLCRVCGRRAERAARQQLYCSRACRERGKERTKKAFLGSTTGGPPNPPKKLNGNNGLPSKKWSPTYTSWAAMRSRCGDPNNNRYQHYGARGIVVCERWQTFKHFLADMGERPEGTTLDRIDNNGNYEPGNCRWATPSEQRRNQRPRRPYRQIWDELAASRTPPNLLREVTEIEVFGGRAWRPVPSSGGVHCEVSSCVRVCCKRSNNDESQSRRSPLPAL